MSRRIIDCHNHPYWHGKDIDGLVANMDKLGIEKTWLLSWELPRHEFDVTPGYYAAFDPRGIAAPLNGVLEGLRAYPDRFVGGWAPDPRDRHARARLTAAVRIHGIRVYGELKCRMRYDNPDAIAMFRHCGDLGLPVLFHLQFYRSALEKQCEGIDAWPEWHGGDIDVVDAMCRMCPRTFFIGHATCFWRHISGDATRDTESYPKKPVKPRGRLKTLLRKHGNLYCDFSAGSGRNALERDMKHARRFVREFQDRILFGRDMYDARHLDVLDELGLGEDILDKVLRRNAEAVLKKAWRRRRPAE